jgi:hypothetical protein
VSLHHRAARPPVTCAPHTHGRGPTRVFAPSRLCPPPPLPLVPVVRRSGWGIVGADRPAPPPPPPQPYAGRDLPPYPPVRIGGHSSERRCSSACSR